MAMDKQQSCRRCHLWQSHHIIFLRAATVASGSMGKCRVWIGKCKWSAGSKRQFRQNISNKSRLTCCNIPTAISPPWPAALTTMMKCLPAGENIQHKIELTPLEQMPSKISHPTHWALQVRVDCCDLCQILLGCIVAIWMWEERKEDQSECI